MLAALTPIDYGVFGLLLATWLAIGAYFSARQKDTSEYFLAGRSLGSLPLGVSLAAIFVSLLGYNWLSAQAYDYGWQTWIIVLALWLALPAVVFVAIPLYRGLGVVSLYEYLEQRFSPAVRLVASSIFIVWRMLWLVVALYLPCAALRLATGWAAPVWLLVLAIGGLAMLGVFLGGQRASAWSGLYKGLAMCGGAAVAMIAVWASIQGAPPRVLEIARGLGRMEPVELDFSWTNPWTLWGALPFWVLTVLTFFIADQLVVQRFLAAKTENLARTAYLTCALVLSMLVPSLIYVGTCLLAYYYVHPDDMRPEWVTNIDGRTRLSVLGADQRSLLEEGNPAHAITFENIDRLVAEGRILQPNNKEQFTSAEGLVHSETNRLRIEKLAMRRPNSDRMRGELIVSRAAPQEMLPHFARRRLSWGAAGLFMGALVATALVAIDAGLLSISTVIVHDLMSRFGWGRAWFSRRVGKPADQLSPTDALQVARPLTLVLGAGLTILTSGLALLMPAAGPWNIVVGVAGAMGSPLLAVLLLGMLTRRATAAGALLALASGLLVTLGLSLIATLAAVGILPPQYRLAEIWPAISGFVFTLAVGYGFSFLVGRPRTSLDLRGLVAGCGELGRRAVDEAIPLISVPEEADEIRWK